MTQSKRPRIAITMRIDLMTDRFYLARAYSEAVEAAGATPFHVSLIPRADYIESLMEEVDGVVLPGSDSDVEPTLYGHEPHRRLGTVHPLKDETDMLVLREIERRSVPLLAICFGMQILNVARGGTLVQDIESQIPQAIKHQQGSPRDRRSHRVRLLEGSQMRELAESETALVNSHHHQAIEKVGSDLVATAWTADGLVEALEDPREGHFALAVQWHPEIAWEQDPFAQRLFAKFVQTARDYREARPSRVEGDNALRVR